MFSILFQSQLHLQVQPHLSSARLPLLGSGTTKLLHLDHLSDLLSQPHLPRPQLLGPNPILPRPLDSRVTPPLYLGKVLIPHQVSGWLSSLMILVVTLKCNTFFFFFLNQVEAFSLEEPVHLELQPTTPQVCLLSEQDLQPPLLPLPTPLSLPNQVHLEVDSTLGKLRLSILGMLLFLSLQLICKVFPVYAHQNSLNPS